MEFEWSGFRIPLCCLLYILWVFSFCTDCCIHSIPMSAEGYVQSYGVLVWLPSCYLEEENVKNVTIPLGVPLLCRPALNPVKLERHLLFCCASQPHLRQQWGKVVILSARTTQLYQRKKYSVLTGNQWDYFQPWKVICFAHLWNGLYFLSGHTCDLLHGASSFIFMKLVWHLFGNSPCWIE